MCCGQPYMCVIQQIILYSINVDIEAISCLSAVLQGCGMCGACPTTFIREQNKAFYLLTWTASNQYLVLRSKKLHSLLCFRAVECAAVPGADRST